MVHQNSSRSKTYTQPTIVREFGRAGKRCYLEDILFRQRIRAFRQKFCRPLLSFQLRYLRRQAEVR